MFSLCPLNTAGDSEDSASDRGPGPLNVSDLWTDPLDDLSHVYIPQGGLVNVEVSGGDAHLKAGETNGWIASEVITIPEERKYDLVYLDVDTPGSSYVELSVLNATADPIEIGFANETIGSFKLVEATDVSIYSIGTKLYPEIRIQATLHASGTDMPRLLAWSVYFIGLEEWRDDFLGKAKMEKDGGLNLTNGALEINLSRGGGGGSEGSYEAYPPIFFPWGGVLITPLSSNLIAATPTILLVPTSITRASTTPPSRTLMRMGTSIWSVPTMVMLVAPSIAKSSGVRPLEIGRQRELQP
jgi:hypothetical protein